MNLEWRRLVLASGLLVALPLAAGAQDSLSGSLVVFDSSVGGATSYTQGVVGTFCFRAESFTNDYEYRYNVWLRFPTDWVVSNVVLTGTPSCTSGSWGTFSWSFETSPYELNIYHPAYQQTSDHCTSYYCVTATAGGPGGASPAAVSWYYDGDQYGGPPHHPCSNDQYTPASMAAEPCDEWTQLQALVPSAVPVELQSFNVE